MRRTPGRFDRPSCYAPAILLLLEEPIEENQRLHPDPLRLASAAVAVNESAESASERERATRRFRCGYPAMAQLSREFLLLIPLQMQQTSPFGSTRGWVTRRSSHRRHHIFGAGADP